MCAPNEFELVDWLACAIHLSGGIQCSVQAKDNVSEPEFYQDKKKRMKIWNLEFGNGKAEK